MKDTEFSVIACRLCTPCLSRCRSLQLKYECNAKSGRLIAAEKLCLVLNVNETCNLYNTRWGLKCVLAVF